MVIQWWERDVFGWFGRSGVRFGQLFNKNSDVIYTVFKYVYSILVKTLCTISVLTHLPNSAPPSPRPIIKPFLTIPHYPSPSSQPPPCLHIKHCCKKGPLVHSLKISLVPGVRINLKLKLSNNFNSYGLRYRDIFKYKVLWLSDIEKCFIINVSE